jgi:hypothetical protein
MVMVVSEIWHGNEKSHTNDEKFESNSCLLGDIPNASKLEIAQSDAAANRRKRFMVFGFGVKDDFWRRRLSGVTEEQQRKLPSITRNGRL